MQKWVVVFAAVVLGALLSGRLQSPADAQAPQVFAPQSPAPMVLSAADIGFRVESRNGSVPVGRWVVRLNGQWVEPQLRAGFSPVEGSR